MSVWVTVEGTTQGAPQMLMVGRDSPLAILTDETIMAIPIIMAKGIAIIVMPMEAWIRTTIGAIPLLSTLTPGPMWQAVEINGNQVTRYPNVNDHRLGTNRRQGKRCNSQLLRPRLRPIPMCHKPRNLQAIRRASSNKA
jgi:hypothetical protein